MFSNEQQDFEIPLFPVAIFKHTEAVYTILGTNHVLSYSSSFELESQHQHNQKVITNVAAGSIKNAIQTDLAQSKSTTSLPLNCIPQHPYCFIANTDSRSFFVDSATNWFIVNDTGMVYNLKIHEGKIKGIGGNWTRTKGFGTMSLPLKSGWGDLDIIDEVPVVYVPSSPYNLIPPHFLVSLLKSRHYRVK